MSVDYVDVVKNIYLNFRELKKDVIELMKDRINNMIPSYKRKEFQGKWYPVPGFFINLDKV